MDQETDESSGPNQLKCMALGRGHHGEFPRGNKSFEVYARDTNLLLNRNGGSVVKTVSGHVK